MDLGLSTETLVRCQWSSSSFPLHTTEQGNYILKPSYDFSLGR